MFHLARSQVNIAEDNPNLPQLPNSIQLANQGRKQMMKCRSREERDLWVRTMREAVENATKHSPADVGPLRKDTLPLFVPSGPIGSDSGSISGSTIVNRTSSIHGSGSISGPSRPFSDSRSVASKSSNDTSGSGSKPVTRKVNPADFYGGSFGADLNLNMNEDNYQRPSPLALSTAMSKNSSSSSVSTGVTTGSSTLTITSKPGLGAMLAAIPVEELTPKQAKAKEALAAAVEARRQERLKREMKNGGTPPKSEMNKNVNLDFSSSFIPAKERIAKT